MIQRNQQLVHPLILLACLVSSAIAFAPSSERPHHQPLCAPTRSQRSRGGATAPVVRPSYDATGSALHASIKHRLTFNSPPPLQNNGKEPPKLILISGCPGTGKSTFGMSLALEQGILKCISTDTVRAVMRSYVPNSISPPLHRSSYAPSSDDATDDAVKSWIETCRVLDSSVEGLVDDAIERGVSLVLEGVNLEPSRKYIDKFAAAGGSACGVLLVVSNEAQHEGMLLKRGFSTGNAEAEEKKLKSFDRVRQIQEEMIRSARESGWVLIEQRVDPDPLDVVADELYKASACMMKDALMDELEEDCVVPTTTPADSDPGDGGRRAARPIDELVRAEKEHYLAQAADEDSKEQIEI